MGVKLAIDIQTFMEYDQYYGREYNKNYHKNSLLNFYIMRDETKDKNNRSFLNTLLGVARRVINTLSYREDEVVKNIVVNFVIIKRVYLNTSLLK